MPQPASRRLITEASLAPLVVRVDALDGKGQRGYTIDQSVGRVIKVWDYINNREQVIYGDTGFRELPNDPVKTGETGSIVLRRSGNLVEVNIVDKPAAVGGNPAIINIPAGFRPRGWVNTNLSGVYDSVAPAVNGLRITTAGDVIVYGVTAGEILRGQVVFMTPDPWPTTLPGKASGVIPS